MYLHDLVASLRRRWYLVFVAMVLTATASLGVARMVGPTYEAQGAVVLLPPADPENPDANRFLSLGSLKQAADVLIRSLRNDATHAAIIEAVPASDYVIEPDYTTSAPVVVVRASSASAGGAAKVLGAVLRQVPATLRQLQDGQAIAPTNQIVAEGIDVDSGATRVVKGQLRAAAAAGVLLLGALGVFIGALDGWLLRRRQRGADIHSVPPKGAGKAADPTPIGSAGRAPRGTARSRP
jgi:hypothetical protein